jgi:hypothetical protein
LFLNPLGNFDFSMVIPGYEKSNFMTFKEPNDEDKLVCDEIKNFKQSKIDKRNKELNDEDEPEEVDKELKHSNFRFIR